MFYFFDVIFLTGYIQKFSSILHPYQAFIVVQIFAEISATDFEVFG